MRVLLVGAGGVGSAFVKIAARRDFIESLVVADIDAGRATAAAAAFGDRATGVALDASDASAVEAILRAEGSTVLMNAADPRFVMPLFDAAFAAGADYVDMAMSLSQPHPDRPYEECGV